MPQKTNKPNRGWTSEELTVLLALFISSPFKSGDDRNSMNRRIAARLARKRGAIDAQWRNIKYHLFRLDLYGVPDRHVGENVKTIVDRYRRNLRPLRRSAKKISKKHGWGLSRYL
jgi:hypothetical protein